MNINQTVPISISIVSKIRDTPANLLTVINNSYNETKQLVPPSTQLLLNNNNNNFIPATNMKFAVCIKPLHFDYNRVSEYIFLFY